MVDSRILSKVNAFLMLGGVCVVFDESNSYTQ